MARTPPSAHAEPVVPQAGWILRQIAASPGDPLTAAIVGPGGTGKSTLVKAIAAAYAEAGVRAVRVDGDTDVAGLADDAPLLVDDAHRLSPAALAALRERARAAGARMVVNYRPWPRPDGISSLGAQLSRHHSPIVLGHLGREEVAEQVARRVGCEPPDALVALVYEQSGGLPMFVGLVTQAMLDTGRFDPRHPDRFRRPPRVSVSPGLAERLRYLLEALDPRIYTVLEALALGAPLDAEVLCALLDAEPADLGRHSRGRARHRPAHRGRRPDRVRPQPRAAPHPRAAVPEHAAQARGDPAGERRSGARPPAGSSRSRGPPAPARPRCWRPRPTRRCEPRRTSRSSCTTRPCARAAAPGRSPRRRAQAAALAGDAAQALRLADEILTAEGATEADRRRAVSVTAGDPRPARVRRPHRRAVPAPAAGADALLAVPALLAAGERDRAREVLAAAPPSQDDAPTLTASAVRLLAAGVLESVDGNAALALSHLTQAASLLESAGDAVLLPYSPAELVAVVAAQCGEVALADTILGQAVAAKLGGGLAHARHLLLHGWNALTRGALDAAQGVLDRVGAAPLEPGDELLAAALATGLARRTRRLGRARRGVRPRPYRADPASGRPVPGAAAG